MAFILTDQRLSAEDAAEAFGRYQRYLRDVGSLFPPDAFRLASSEWYDGHIELRYRDVKSYACNFTGAHGAANSGHADWRYDEFRLSDAGVVVQ